MDQHKEQENSNPSGSMEDPMLYHHHGERSIDIDPPISATAEKEETSSHVPKHHRSLSVKNLLAAGRSFKSMRRSSRDDDIDQEASTGGGGEQETAACIMRSLSFSRFFSFRVARVSSLAELDSDHDDQLTKASENDASLSTTLTKEIIPMHRSQSLPMNMKRFKESTTASPGGGVFRVSLVSSNPPLGSSRMVRDEQREEEMVTEEEAVCRICMVALSEGISGSSLKLECSCKGELALAHRECAIKWFRIKGNGNCDVCKEEVRNLPVTLQRIHTHPQISSTNNSAADDDQQHQPSSSHHPYRLWRGTPILVIISMLAYFCFLEQLLVADHGTAALAISLPFACVLGLFSSLTTTNMVSRRSYVWIYAGIQFLLIVLFTHIFYRYVRMQEVISIILATFAGFGVAMCANSILHHIASWKASRSLSIPHTSQQHHAIDI